MQKKKNKLKIFLNSSQHIFDLGLSETIMLRNYANKNNWKFCSMIGGSESIRDLEESKNLFVDAFEFPLVESSFSLLKILPHVRLNLHRHHTVLFLRQTFKCKFNRCQRMESFIPTY